MVLKPEEYIITAFAAPQSGPGWANRPVIVIIGTVGDSEMRMEWIQPDALTPAMMTLYRASALMHEDMRKQASAVLGIEVGRF